MMAKPKFAIRISKSEIRTPCSMLRKKRKKARASPFSIADLGFRIVDFKDAVNEKQ
jgi:hypothetical protein